MAKIGRNDPCACGSGKKYKKCCMAGDEAARPCRSAGRGAGAPAVPGQLFPGTRRTRRTDRGVSNAVVDMVQAVAISMPPRRPPTICSNASPMSMTATTGPRHGLRSPRRSSPSRRAATAKPSPSSATPPRQLRSRVRDRLPKARRPARNLRRTPRPAEPESARPLAPALAGCSAASKASTPAAREPP